MWTKIPSLEPKIEGQLEDFLENLPPKLVMQTSEILLIGSASRGEATYRSDLDILVILKEGPLNYSRIQELRDLLDMECFSKFSTGGLPFQVQFVLPSVRQTGEPAMREALKGAHVLMKCQEET